MGYDRYWSEEELLSDVFTRYPALECCRADILRAADLLTDCFRAGGHVYICGNGGSASDSAHIVGELLKGFLSRRALPAAQERAFRAYGELGELMADKLQGSLGAVDLTAQSAILAAVANDTDARLAYAQQLWGLGRRGDLLIGISTSGNAANVLCAGIAARELGMRTVALTGEGGGKMAELFEVAIRVPSRHTPAVQEYHLPVYHLLCAVAEARLFPRPESEENAK